MREIRTLVAAGAVVVAVTAITVAFGLRRLPDLAHVTEPPAVAPPGRIAYTADDGCLHVVPADGRGDGRRLCDLDIDPWTELRWVGDRVAFRDPQLWDVEVLVDPGTGEVVDRRTAPYREPAHDDDGIVLNGGADGEATLAVRRGLRVDEVLRLEGPSDYAFHAADRAPGGDWVAVIDSEGRLIVVAVSGPSDARLLVDGEVRRAVWGP